MVHFAGGFLITAQITMRGAIGLSFDVVAPETFVSSNKK